MKIPQNFERQNFKIFENFDLNKLNFENLFYFYSNNKEAFFNFLKFFEKKFFPVILFLKENDILIWKIETNKLSIMNNFLNINLKKADFAFPDEFIFSLKKFDNLPNKNYIGCLLSRSFKILDINDNNVKLNFPKEIIDICYNPHQGFFSALSNYKIYLFNCKFDNFNKNAKIFLKKKTPITNNLIVEPICNKTGQIFCLFNKDSKVIYLFEKKESEINESRFHILNSNTGEVNKILNCEKFSKKNSLLISLYKTGIIIIWNLEKKEILQKINSFPLLENIDFFLWDSGNLRNDIILLLTSNEIILLNFFNRKILQKISLENKFDFNIVNINYISGDNNFNCAKKYPKKEMINYMSINKIGNISTSEILINFKENFLI